MKATQRVYSNVGQPVEAFLRRYRQSTLHIATAFVAPTVDLALTALGLTSVRLLIGLDPSNALVSPTLFKGLQRLRRNKAVEVRCLHGLHAKLYVAPGKAVIISSANFTRAGFEQLTEAAVESSNRAIVTAANALFLEWWGRGTPLGSVALQETVQEETETGAGQNRLPYRYSSAFRARWTKPQQDGPERSADEVLDLLAIDTPSRDALVAFFAEYIRVLPAEQDRWELTKNNYGLRLNVGPLTGLQAFQGEVSMHIRPLSRAERRQLGAQVRTVPGFKSSGRFVKGALWATVPIDRLGRHARVLLPAAISFASEVPYRTSWMYAHSKDALAVIERQSGRRLPRPTSRR